MSELAFRMPPELVEEIALRVAELVAERLPAPTADEPWQLVDVGEAARRLGRSTRWVRDRVKAGELPRVALAPLANRRGSGGSPWGSCSREAVRP